MILIALGANLPSSYGSPAETLEEAIKALHKRGILIKAQSHIWLTAPVPVSDQPDYHNAVVAVKTDLDAEDLLKELQSVEQAFGRVRTVRNAPRTIDLDLIAYDDQILQNGLELIVPHPRMQERAFVLLPLQEVAPDWVHPVLKETLSSLIKKLPVDQSARRL